MQFLTTFVTTQLPKFTSVHKRLRPKKMLGLNIQTNPFIRFSDILITEARTDGHRDRLLKTCIKNSKNFNAF